MGILVNLTWGDSWRRPKEGLGRVVDQVQAAGALRMPTGPDDPSVDIYIYVSGSVWQHQRDGFRLGTLSSRGRDWLRVMIYVPDDLAEEVASIACQRTGLTGLRRDRRNVWTGAEQDACRGQRDQPGARGQQVVVLIDGEFAARQPDSGPTGLGPPCSHH